VRLALTVACLVTISTASRANQCAIPSDLDILERDGITVNSVNLTGVQFLKSYMSGCADEERSADLYLLGVMDATEGEAWCDYHTIKSVSLREFIFEKLKKMDASQLKERASKVLEVLLHQAFPCRKKK
jgi:hypothetical protein